MHRFLNSAYAMKAKTFLWTAAIWTVFVLALYFISQAREGSKMGFFPLLVIGWILVTVVSILLLALRVFKKYRHNGSAFYLILGEANLVIVSYGFYQVLSPNARDNLYGIILLFAANGVMALMILRDYFTTDDQAE